MFTVDEKSILVAKIPEVLSAEECQSLIAKIDDIGPEIAPINTGQGTRAHRCSQQRASDVRRRRIG